MTCRTCDCADKAADTDEWVTFAKRPVEARLTAERDALQVGRDRDRVKGATVVLNEELRTRDISTLAGLYADVAAAGVTVSDVLEHRA